MQRRLFQRGLLSLLRGEEAGAAAMRDAVAGIEDVTIAPTMRSFWWTVGAMLDAVAANGLASSSGVKQLVARIDLQIRRVAEGSTKVADRLRREVLYYVAVSEPSRRQCAKCSACSIWPTLIPSAEVLSADMLRIEPLLRQAREQIASAKEAWLKFASGRAENLPRLKQMMATVKQHATDIGNAALTRLISSLSERLDDMPALNMPEAIAMEYATGLLFAENAFENYANLAREFPQQVSAMLARLDAAQANRPVDVAAAPLLDEMSKLAHERLLVAQVCREIQTNLRRMEQVLDGFFRDQEKRAELATLANDSRQIRGALRMLGLDQADELLGLCEAEIETYARSELAVANDDLELLAESLSSLGFYVEAVEQQRPGRERLIAPLLAKRQGKPVEVPAEEAVVSAESAVREFRDALPELVAEAHRAPADDAIRDQLKTKLSELRDDAELIGDSELVAQAGSALAELQAGPTTVAFEAAVSAITDSGGGAPAPSLSEETQRLLASDEKELDAEFLDIYLTEASEVLDSIGESLVTLRQTPGAREALRTVRRGFHTLKGSGRMVGLTELGQIAYSVEKIQNRLLEDDRAVTPAVVAMIAVAEKSFRQWVADLRRDGRVHPDAASLDAAIRDVEEELAGHRVATPKPAIAASARTRLRGPAGRRRRCALSTRGHAGRAAAAIHTANAGGVELAELGSASASLPEVVAADEVWTATT
jgi:chemosensory pili system protein ChpA (sensor histidine kinase/response regulator)